MEITHAPIFISYRRADTGGRAGRLRDQLADHFGPDRVFLDVESIRPGQDFTTLVVQVISDAKVMILVIGREWLGPPDAHRVGNADDLVRLEVATAIRRKVPIIPVLVDGASMPAAADLPQEIRQVSRIDAARIEDAGFRHGVDRLITSLKELVPPLEGASSAERFPGLSAEATNERYQEARRVLDDAVQSLQEYLDIWDTTRERMVEVMEMIESGAVTGDPGQIIVDAGREMSERQRKIENRGLLQVTDVCFSLGDDLANRYERFLTERGEAMWQVLSSGEPNPTLSLVGGVRAAFEPVMKNARVDLAAFYAAGRKVLERVRNGSNVTCSR